MKRALRTRFRFGKPLAFCLLVVPSLYFERCCFVLSKRLPIPMLHACPFTLLEIPCLLGPSLQAPTLSACSQPHRFPSLPTQLLPLTAAPHIYPGQVTFFEYLTAKWGHPSTILKSMSTTSTQIKAMRLTCPLSALNTNLNLINNRTCHPLNEPIPCLLSRSTMPLSVGHSSALFYIHPGSLTKRYSRTSSKPGRRPAQTHRRAGQEVRCSKRRSKRSKGDCKRAARSYR